MAHLAFEKGTFIGRMLELTPGDLTIGRQKGCDILIPNDQVSSRHAQLRWEQGRWTLTDLGSSNGTAVNGDLITSVTLRDGDVIQVGTEVIVFHDGDGGATKAKRPASAQVAAAEEVALVEEMSQRTRRIREEVAKVIVGQQEVLDQMLMVLIANGHGLLVGMPGMAKTLMVSTVARVLDLEFKRVQFTPDLMPTDITGTEVLETNRETQEKAFRFIRGPIFCNLLLADEINRTPPKTQAALLEAMQERRVTVGNVTYPLDQPFLVLATQNPIEQEGTYPLPEAQMDRFMFNIWVDYPLEHEEEAILASTTMAGGAKPEKVLGKEEVLQLQEVVRKIPVSEHVVKYAARLVRSTRPANPNVPDFIRQYVSTGSGPRAGQFLILAAKARAVLEGRIHVSCADIRRAALPVLRHRLYLNFAADSEGITPARLVERLLEAVPEPSEKDYL